MLFPFGFLYSYYKIFEWDESAVGSVYRMDKLMILLGGAVSIFLFAELIIFFFRPKKVSLVFSLNSVIIKGEQCKVDHIYIKRRGNTSKVCLSYRNNIFWQSFNGLKSNDDIEALFKNTDTNITFSEFNDTNLT